MQEFSLFFQPKFFQLMHNDFIVWYKNHMAIGLLTFEG